LTALTDQIDSQGIALTSELKEFIDSAVVPALVKTYLIEMKKENCLVSDAGPVENLQRILPSAEERKR
jgi:hypothetical protein